MMEPKTQNSNSDKTTRSVFIPPYQLKTNEQVTSIGNAINNNATVYAPIHFNISILSTPTLNGLGIEARPPNNVGGYAKTKMRRMLNLRW